VYINRLKRDCALLDLPIAHKGVFGNVNNNEIKENSLDSIKASINKNIPFEIDIVKTKDNVPIVYHDFTIDINGIVYKISNYSLEELRNLANDTNLITTLEECIKENSSFVPMILDFKETSLLGLNQYRKNIISLLESYKGEHAIQSFNPFFICTMKKYLPEALFGQLICRGKTLIDTLNPKHPRFSSTTYEKLLSTICYISGADYIGLEISKSKKWKTKAEKIIFSATDEVQNRVIGITSKLTKMPVIGWTLTDLSELNILPKFFDNYVFEPDAFENYNLFFETIKENVKYKNNF